VKTAASWDMVSSSADTSSYASRLGVQTAYLLTNVEELCVQGSLCSEPACMANPSLHL